MDKTKLNILLIFLPLGSFALFIYSPPKISNKISPLLTRSTLLRCAGVAVLRRAFTRFSLAAVAQRGQAASFILELRFSVFSLAFQETRLTCRDVVNLPNITSEELYFI